MIGAGSGFLAKGVGIAGGGDWTSEGYYGNLAWLSRRGLSETPAESDLGPFHPGVSPVEIKDLF